jgi:hypothetical protein
LLTGLLRGEGPGAVLGSSAKDRRTLSSMGSGVSMWLLSLLYVVAGRVVVLSV